MIDKIKEYHNIIDNINMTDKPYLFMHVCCAPCASHILIDLVDYFNIYIIFYNPNIDTIEEYEKRLFNLKIFIDKTDLKNKIHIIYERYEHDRFLDYVKGYEKEPEGKIRCEKCIYMRLDDSIKIAEKYIIDNNIHGDIYFVTSLSTSPYKNAEYIYDIGKKLCEGTRLKYLPSDFKKEDGYLDSIKLSKKYEIYRQNYCGCEFSKNT